ncbi:MAG: permease component of ABC-type sugar transporter [Geminicoccaceae bacterium]|jgi:multiple sugar transport system permease protein|nr:permease component of ABC-type sugar transporter [Geminicoccaceae bacterium]MDF2766055.1 permease component of ABC-type sugar transporter [Rhodospirillales bacterium]
MHRAYPKAALPDSARQGALAAPTKALTRVGYERPGFAFLLNTPALVALILLAAYPIVSSAWMSLHKYSLKRPRIFEFIGLENFRQLLDSDEFWSALWITLKFTGLVVALVTLLGLLIALLLNRRFPGSSLLRTLLLIPWAIPPVVNGLMWQWIYDSKVGALNGLLVSLGLLSDYRGWLSDSTSALIALVWADVWNLVPLAVILLLAALQRIPDELYDAARVDGAGPLQMFRYVTFPWLAQALLIVLILQTMAAIRAFDVIYVLTAGGPGNATTTLTWQTFLTTFESLNFGLGNAYAWTVSIITLSLALFYFRLLFRRGEFET